MNGATGRYMTLLSVIAPDIVYDKQKLSQHAQLNRLNGFGIPRRVKSGSLKASWREGLALSGRSFVGRQCAVRESPFENGSRVSDLRLPMATWIMASETSRRVS